MTKKKGVQVHVTSNGGVYVEANELMRRDAARKAIEQAKRISRAMNYESTQKESGKAT